MKEVTIPNWAMYGPISVGIDLFKMPADDGTFYYSASLNLSLDDYAGEDTGEEDEFRIISLITEIEAPTPDETIDKALYVVWLLFGISVSIVLSCSIIELDTGKIIDEVDITEKIAAGGEPPATLTKPTLH